MEIRTVSLKNYSSIKIGGESLLVDVMTTAELIEVLMYAKNEALRVHVVGEGTNTFFADILENTLFIKNSIKGISLEQDGQDFFLKAGAGENWDTVVRFTVEKGLWGLENLSHIPGTVGAAPVQNIGAYGVELKDVFLFLEAIDMETLDLVSISGEACEFGYRDSLFKHVIGRYCIVSVTMKVSLQPHPVLSYKPLDLLRNKENLTPQDVRDCVIKTRAIKLPDYREYPNTGSFFKNPIISKELGYRVKERFPDAVLIEYGDVYKIPAAWLIEHVANMKGERIGNVGTWPKQPLVIVNYGEATGDEVMSFSTAIIEKIREKTGIVLEREVNFVT